MTLLERYKKKLEQERAALADLNLAETSGFDICSRWCGWVDNLIKELFIEVVGEPPTGMALAAVGGYGRMELCPESDIDLLFLYDGKVDEKAKSDTKIIPILWDLGFKVGQATRSIADCIDIAEKDLTSKTAMMEARLLFGCEDTFFSFWRKFKKKSVAASADSFISIKRMESDERHIKHLNTPFLTEPDIKESPGGLRDYHSAIWLAIARFDKKNMEELKERAIISQKRYDEVKEAVNIMLKIRSAIHIIEKKPENRLTYNVQVKVARRLGYVSAEEGDVRGEMIGSQKMMRRYYRSADSLYRFYRSIMGKTLRHKKSLSMLRFVSRHKKLTDYIYAGPEELYTKDITAAEMAEKPEVLFEAISHAVTRGLALSPILYTNITAVGQLWKENKPNKKALNVGLQSLLMLDDSADALKILRDTKTLTACLPEFQNIRYLTPFDMYHRYTVDEHTFVAIKEFDNLRLNERKECSVLKRLYQEEQRKDIVRLTILLHDIGKGGDDNHHHDNIDLAIVTNLGYSEEDAKVVQVLVQNHILMNHLAQRRDINDGKTIADLCKTVPDVTMLKRLYMLTFADTTAVGPEIWNSWKGSLLKELFLRGSQQLSGGSSIQADEELMLQLDGNIKKFAASMPQRYMLGRTAKEVNLHANMFELFTNSDNSTLVEHWLISAEEPGQLVVITEDSPRLLNRLVGTLVSKNIEILDAQLFTRSDGVVVDIFRITGTGGEPIKDKALWQRIEKEIIRVLTGEEQVENILRNRQRIISTPQDLPRMHHSVDLLNDDSLQHTVVESSSRNRLGLLYDITLELANIGLNIRSAFISTEGHRAINSFYVSEETGGKVIHEERITAIKQAVLKVL